MYFILEPNKLFSNGPVIDNWKTILNPALICREKFYKISDNIVIQLNTTNNTIFPTIFKVPYLIVSEMMLNVIQMYGDDVLKKEIILVDPSKNLVKRYFLILLEHVRTTDIKESKDHIPIIDVIPVGRPLIDRNIFETDIHQKKTIIVNLDFAESVLRRNAISISLKEIIVNGVSGKENYNER